MSEQQNDGPFDGPLEEVIESVVFAKAAMGMVGVIFEGEEAPIREFEQHIVNAVIQTSPVTVMNGLMLSFVEPVVNELQKADRQDILDNIRGAFSKIGILALKASSVSTEEEILAIAAKIESARDLLGYTAMDQARRSQGDRPEGQVQGGHLPGASHRRQPPLEHHPEPQRPSEQLVELLDDTTP